MREEKQSSIDKPAAPDSGPKWEKYKFAMLFPLVVFLLAFLVDKAFYIGNFPHYFLRTMAFANFRHKVDLTDELALYLQQPDRKKVVVLFGNSRTMGFDNKYIDKKHPDWLLYNYSVPGGTTDYYAYYLRTFEKRRIKPDFAIFTITPQGYNSAPTWAMDEVLIEGLPPSFVLRYATRYSVDDLSNFAAKSLFWNYQYRPKLGVIVQRTAFDSALARAYNRLLAKTTMILADNRGSVPHTEGSVTPTALLDQNAEEVYRQFLVPFRLHEGQLKFTDDTLVRAKKLGIPSFLLWARVAPPLRKLKNERPVPGAGGASVKAIWYPAVAGVAQRNGVEILNMNEERAIACDEFYDASHMAGSCFAEFTDYLFANIDRVLKK